MLNDTTTRRKYNELILRELERAIKENPDLRFIQALWAVGLIDSDSQRDAEGRFKVIDRFFEESVATWERIKANI